MLSYIDPILFPDECVILSLPNGRYVYPIFKNGSSSLFRANYSRLETLSECKVVDVLIREPYQRFYSGVNTYINNMGPGVDQSTALQFVKKYLFLDRHFCPQFFWLLNLRRFTDAKIKLIPFEDISSLTPFKRNESDRMLDFTNVFDDKLDFYLMYDKVLREDLINQEVTFAEIVNTMQSKYPALYQETIGRVKNICNVLG